MRSWELRPTMILGAGCSQSNNVFLQFGVDLIPVFTDAHFEVQLARDAGNVFETVERSLDAESGLLLDLQLLGLASQEFLMWGFDLVEEWMF